MGIYAGVLYGVGWHIETGSREALKTLKQLRCSHLQHRIEVLESVIDESSEKVEKRQRTEEGDTHSSSSSGEDEPSVTISALKEALKLECEHEDVQEYFEEQAPQGWSIQSACEVFDDGNNTKYYFMLPCSDLYWFKQRSDESRKEVLDFAHDVLDLYGDPETIAVVDIY